jgi:maltose alpha-D-glucosyltransferase/alpha-amylase
MGSYIEAVRLLGQRTGELHLALASQEQDPRFAPEPFTAHYQRSLYQSMRNRVPEVLALLVERQGLLPESARDLAGELIRAEGDLLAAFRGILGRHLDAKRIRGHGSYGLEHVLYTGSDFSITDFGGDAAFSPAERRFKRSPLRDVAGMLHSFDLVSSVALESTSATVRDEDSESLRAGAPFWRRWVSSAIQRAYQRSMRGSRLLPTSRSDVGALLRFLMLEKAIYALKSDLSERLEAVPRSIRKVLDLLEEE